MDPLLNDYPIKRPIEESNNGHPENVTKKAKLNKVNNGNHSSSSHVNHTDTKKVLIIIMINIIASFH